MPFFVIFCVIELLLFMLFGKIPSSFALLFFNSFVQKLSRFALLFPR